MLFVLCLTLPAAPTFAAEKLPAQLDNVAVKEQLGKHIDLDLEFKDHRGQSVALRDYFRGGKPVLLTLNYYRCRTLCNLQLNALTNGLRELGWAPGDSFRVVTVSINPREGPTLARDKRAAHLAALGLGDAGWHFLVGKKPQIDALAKSVGFSYRYLPKEDQYAHPAVVFFLSPKGKLSRYLYGIQFPSRQLKLALIDASDGVVGSTIDKVLLSCFHYDASAGRYGPFAFGIMRLGAIATVLVLGTILLAFWRKERRQTG